MANDQTMDRTLRQVLAVGNGVQNQLYTPSVFSIHYNLVTSFVLTEGAKVFGYNQYIKDLLRPFVKNALLPVVSGKAEIPPDYRHYTGISIFVQPDFTGCIQIDGLAPGQAPTPAQIKDMQEKVKSVGWDLDMKEVDEFKSLTTHSYKKPQLSNAIACIYEPGYISVSPYDIPFIQLHYIKQPKVYNYGYKVNADDTYSYDPTMQGAIETEWMTNADDLLFKGCQALYAVYIRDGELANGIEILKKEGLF